MKHFFLFPIITFLSLSTHAQQLDWINSYGSTSAYADYVFAVATDEDGYVYITGSYQGQIQIGSFTLPSLDNDNVFIAKLDSSGTCLWVQSYGGTTAGAERSRNMVIDYDGNLVVVGNFFGATTFGGTTYNSVAGNSDMFVLKLDPSGNIIWSKAFLGTGYDMALGLCVDHSNNIIVSGQYSGTLTLEGIQLTTSATNATESLIFKLNPNGNVQWAKKGGASGFFAGNSSTDVAVDASGSVYLVGYFTTSIVFDNLTVYGAGANSCYLAKYSSNGQIQWAKKGSGPNARVGAFGVAVSPDNRIGVTGFYDGAADFNNVTAPNSSNWNIFLLEYDTSGELLWHAFGSDSSEWASGSARGYSISYDEDANMYVSGRGNANWAGFGDTTTYYLNGEIIKGEIFVLRFNAARELETCSWLETADVFNTCCGLMNDNDNYYDTSKRKHAVYGNSVYLIENFTDYNQNSNTFSLSHNTGVAGVPRFGNGDFLIAKFNTCITPVANFSKTQNLLTATFTNTSVNAASIQWNFGDGATATGNTVSHTYGTSGYYTVCLIATSECGGKDTLCQGILLSCPVPVSAFTHTATSTTINFTSLGSGLTSHSWQFGDGSTSAAINPSHTYSAPGTYLACLTTTNGCGSSATCQNITVTCPVPSYSFTYAIDSLTVAFTPQGSSSFPATLSWQFGDGTSIAGLNPSHTYWPGTYTVCLTSESVCGTTSSCQTISVSCSGTFDISYEGANELCYGDELLLEGNSDVASYEWNTGATTPTITVHQTGEYFVTGSSISSGCTMVSDTIVVTFGSLPGIIYNGTALTCNPSFATYQWFLNDTLIEGATSQTYTPLVNGIYHVAVTDLIGCSEVSSVWELFNLSIGATSGISGMRVSVYPNPAHDYVLLEVSDVIEALSYEVMNSVGQIVSLGTASTERTRIDAQELAPDVYVLRLLDNGRAIHYERVVVMH